MHPFSVAIIQYLCNRYDLPEHWYPRKDIKAQAKVNEYLNWQHANTRMNCAMVFRHLVSRPGIVKYVKTPGFLVAQLLWILCATLKKASSTNKYEETHSFFIIHATKSIKLCSQETFLKIDNLRKIAPPPQKKISMIDEKQTVTDDMMLMKLKKCKIIAASFFFVDTCIFTVILKCSF